MFFDEELTRERQLRRDRVLDMNIAGAAPEHVNAHLKALE